MDLRITMEPADREQLRATVVRLWSATRDACEVSRRWVPSVDNFVMRPPAMSKAQQAAFIAANPGKQIPRALGTRIAGVEAHIWAGTVVGSADDYSAAETLMNLMRLADLTSEGFDRIARPEGLSISGVEVLRMLALQGYPLGLSFRFFDPNANGPANDMADQQVERHCQPDVERDDD